MNGRQSMITSATRLITLLLLMMLLYIQRSQARSFAPDTVKAEQAKRFYSWEEAKRTPAVIPEDYDEINNRRYLYPIGKRFRYPVWGDAFQPAMLWWPSQQ